MKQIQTFLFLFLFIFNTHASESGIVPFISKKLPEKLQKLAPGKTTTNEVLQIVGKAHKEKGDKYFYKLDHKKYDTTISLKNGKINYFIFKFRPGVLKISDLFQWVEKERIQKAYEAKMENSHDAGNLFRLPLPEYGLYFVVSRSSDKWIDAVTVMEKQ